MRAGIIALLLLALVPGAARAVGLDALTGAWPAAGAGAAGVPITFPSSSPFSLADVGKGPERDPPTDAVGTLFLPAGAGVQARVPAVVLLHGAAGVRAARELTYGRQLAAMGIAVVVVDAFAARRDRGTGFTERLLNITEAMLLADGYAALRYLGTRPEIDAGRIVVAGFSYGGMVSSYAAYAQVAARYAPDGRRFAGHVSFYGPCIARFDDPRTTGAPLLLMYGGKDEIIDPARCDEIAGDLRKGGSQVEMITYPEAYHQWDGGPVTPWRASTGLAGCRFSVDPDGTTRDVNSGLVMEGPISRRLILAFCVDRDGYLVGRNDDVRTRSDRAFGRFLAERFK